MTKYLTRRAKFIGGALVAVVVSLSTLGQVWAQQASSYPTEADKVHVVILVFGHKGGISAACQKDCKGVRTVLEASFAQDPERLVIHDLSQVNPETGKYYSKDETLAVISSMKVGRNDNVVIFQSGHGAIANKDEPETSHKLTMDFGAISRPQLQGPIEAMDPRAIIFLSDCCSSFSKKKTDEVNERELQSVVEPNIKNIRKLVLCPIGIISITAAQDGKTAIASFKGANPGKAGSAFTVALLRLWYNEETTYNSWSEFFPALRAETGLASGNKHMARAFQIKEAGVVIMMARDTSLSRTQADVRTMAAQPVIRPARRLATVVMISNR